MHPVPAHLGTAALSWPCMLVNQAPVLAVQSMLHACLKSHDAACWQAVLQAGWPQPGSCTSVLHTSCYCRGPQCQRGQPRGPSLGQAPSIRPAPPCQPSTSGQGNRLPWAPTSCIAPATAPPCSLCPGAAGLSAAWGAFCWWGSAIWSARPGPSVQVRLPRVRGCSFWISYCSRCWYLLGCTGEWIISYTPHVVVRLSTPDHVAARCW